MKSVTLLNKQEKLFTNNIERFETISYKAFFNRQRGCAAQKTTSSKGSPEAGSEGYPQAALLISTRLCLTLLSASDLLIPSSPFLQPIYWFERSKPSFLLLRPFLDLGKLIHLAQCLSREGTYFF